MLLCMTFIPVPILLFFFYLPIAITPLLSFAHAAEIRHYDDRDLGPLGIIGLQPQYAPVVAGVSGDRGETEPEEPSCFNLLYGIGYLGAEVETNFFELQGPFLPGPNAHSPAKALIRRPSQVHEFGRQIDRRLDKGLDFHCFDLSSWIIGEDPRLFPDLPLITLCIDP
jgi:hypothetical protein